MGSTVATGQACARVCAFAVMLVFALALGGCAKGAQEAGSRSDSLRGGGAGQPATLGGAVCGDGVVSAGSEECDGMDLAGASCRSLGFASGMLLCTSGCSYDRSMCGSAPPPMPGAGTGG